MSRSIQKLDLTYVDSITDIFIHAYTGLGHSEKDREGVANWVINSISTWPHQDIYGIFEDDILLGGMCLLEFDLNTRGTILKAGGIGTVAVGLLHKKQKVARDLLLGALRHYRDKGIPLVTLYPFRADFYRRMGFGFGAQVQQFRLSPSAWPEREVRGNVRILAGSDEDRSNTLACYNCFLRRMNGMTQRLDWTMGDAFTPETKVIGYEEDGELKGYFVAAFEREYDFNNHLVVRELIYDSPDALMAFSGFLRRQVDQFKQIVVETQDETLAFFLNDPARGTYDTFASRYLDQHGRHWLDVPGA